MHKINNIRGKLCAAAGALLIGAGAFWGGWTDAQPKFRDVTMSVGEQLPQLERFLNGYAAGSKCDFVTDIGAVDANVAGEYPVTLRSGAREETVMLRIRDTLAPELKVRNLEVPLGTELKPEDFITHLWDHSQVQVSFAEPVAVPEDYAALEVEIVASDIHGNETRATCTASFQWMRSQVNLELGQQLTREDVLYNAEKDAALIADSDLERINTAPIGEYTIVSSLGDAVLACRVTVQDTMGPELVLREHQAYLGGIASLDDFVVSASDPSGEVTLTLLTQPDCSAVGTQTIVITAEDMHGNVTTAETTLYVATDFVAPTIIGADKSMTVAKHSQPDYLAGVSAFDAVDGYVVVNVDDSRVNLSAAGTYFLVYTARDASGNVATIRRKITVEHDAEDTAALVKSIADSLENDPEKIRDYVRSTIYYSTDWGGEDPVWKGFTEKHGNCYVHALCLKSILDLKGYNTQLIWVVNKTHYWLIIEIEPGVWRHIDPTPSELHSRYSLMTDEQRLWTLSRRDWDHSLWPACE